MNVLDISGLKFGNFTAVSFIEVKNKARNAYWKFLCDCGEFEDICAYDVKSGKRSCCKKCKAKQRSSVSKTDEYKIWCDVKTRCTNKNHRSYKNYGGRGISVCKKWLESFDEFMKDLGPRPSKDHSIDRIDYNGNYEPENCRWANHTEQARNKRNNIYVEYEGETMLLVEASEKSGINEACLRARHSKGSDLFSDMKNKGSITFMGITDTIHGWSKRTGIKPSTIAMRIGKYGYTIEKALTTGVKK